MSGIGEIFLSATLEALIQQLGSAAIKFVTSRKRVKASFVKLSGSLAHIKGVLQDAEEKQYAEASVKQWLVSLRDAAYDLEDLLDEIKTKAEEHSRKVSIFSFKTFRKMFFNHKMMSEIDDINNRLKHIEEQRTALKLGSVNSGGSLGKRKDVTSASKPHMLEDELVVGRDEKKKEIVKMLFQSKVDLLVLPIYGMGGIGKTTLAKAVYYDAKVQEKFGFKAMACVSTEFNDLEVTRKIYRAVMNKEPKSKDLDTLQRDLQTALSNKKFLIVLDDIWNEKSEDWENLICPFKKGQPGSIIIVTTRSENVARMVNPNFEAFFCLESLNEADCLSIMFHHAGIYSFDDKQKFEAVGKELSKRCGGLPLAARALGGILVTKREVDEWERVLDNGIWKLENANIMNVLRLSYFDLPPYLKRMFAYCSIFPQDYEFSKKELVLLWMGEGFLDQHPNKQNKQSKEEWGAECFDELLKKSFFQKSFYGYSCLGRLEEFFVMHDLINDLARLISAEICDRWDTENSLEKVRHCSILPQQFEKLKYFPEAKRLRSLVFLVQNYYDWSRSNKFLQDLLPKLRHIRVLSLRNCRFGELPDSICELTHLRYLDLSNSSITTLPNSLDRLIWLEMLSINGCDKISKLPETLGNLRYLRHLDNSWTWGCIPCEIGRLEHLQTLPKVVLSKKGALE